MVTPHISFYTFLTTCTCAYIATHITSTPHLTFPTSLTTPYASGAQAENFWTIFVSFEILVRAFATDHFFLLRNLSDFTILFNVPLLIFVQYFPLA